jgi:hypothetical protein
MRCKQLGRIMHELAQRLSESGHFEDANEPNRRSFLDLGGELVLLRFFTDDRDLAGVLGYFATVCLAFCAESAGQSSRSVRMQTRFFTML